MLVLYNSGSTQYTNEYVGLDGYKIFMTTAMTHVSKKWYDGSLVPSPTPSFPSLLSTVSTKQRRKAGRGTGNEASTKVIIDWGGYRGLG